MSERNICSNLILISVYSTRFPQREWEQINKVKFHKIPMFHSVCHIGLSGPEGERIAGKINEVCCDIPALSSIMPQEASHIRFSGHSLKSNQISNPGQSE